MIIGCVEGVFWVVWDADILGVVRIVWVSRVKEHVILCQL